LTRTCNVSECARTPYAQGWCKLHYSRWSRTGSLEFRRGNGITNGNELEHGTWNAMKRRCTDTNSPRYRDYGGRGITVYAPWMHSFAAFLRDVGPRPGKEFTLERINNNGNYEPGNVRWATTMEQAQNRRTSVYVTANGETRTIAAWARIFNINPRTLYKRYHRGESDLFGAPTPNGKPPRR
jgi:hypothetical protein